MFRELEEKIKVLQEMKRGNTKNQKIEDERYIKGKNLVERALLPAMRKTDKHFRPIAIMKNVDVAILPSTECKSFVYIRDLIEITDGLKLLFDNYEQVKKDLEDKSTDFVEMIENMRKQGIELYDLLPLNIVEALKKTGLTNNRLMIKLEITDDNVMAFWKTFLPMVNF